MSPSQRFLDTIDVAAPCSASWDAMTGDDQVRHCADCKLNVYNLSAMSEDEAVNLVQETEGRLCVRFFRRADGTVLSKNCPVGLAKVRQHARAAMARVVALVTVMLTSLLGCRGREIPAPGTNGGSERIEMGEAVMGNFCAPEPTMGKIQMTAPPKAPPKEQPEGPSGSDK